MNFSWKSSVLPWQVILSFLLLAAGLALVGGLYYDNQKKHLIAVEGEKLAAIADLKSREISLWRRERMTDALSLSRNPEFIKHVHQFLQNHASGSHLLSDWLRSFPESYQYANILLIDQQRQVRLSLGKVKRPIDEQHAAFIDRVLQEKQLVFSGLHREQWLQPLDLAILVPILVPQGKQCRCVGVVMLIVDPYRSLYPMIQAWPTPSPSGETLLVARAGNDLVYLNELRHRKDTALKFRIPASAKQRPAALAVSGKEGITEGMDYRGVPVLAALRKIPDSPWFLVAKIDLAEIQAPLRDKLGTTILIFSLLILSSATLMVFFWRNQQTLFFRRQSEEQEKAKNLMNIVGVIILALDAEGKVTLINEKGCDILAYKKEEIIGRDWCETFIPRRLRDEVKETLKKLLQGELAAAEYFENPILTKRGEERCIAWHSAVIRDEKGKITGTLSSGEDITERKEAEIKLKKSETLLKEAQHVAHMGHWELDPVSGIQTWSEEIFRIFGLDPVQGEPSLAAHENLLHPEDWPVLDGAVRKAGREGIPFDIEFRLFRPDKSMRWMHARGHAIRNSQGRIIRLFGTAQDITARKVTEEELKASRQQLRGLTRHLQSIREEDRKEIAREIHDELGGALTGLKIDLSQLSKNLSLIHDKDKRKWSRDKAGDMMKLIDKIIHSARRIMSDLRPSVLDDFGLSAALEGQIHDFQRRTGIPAEYITTLDDLVLDEECSIALFRIVQHSLTNVFAFRRKDAGL